MSGRGLIFGFVLLVLFSGAGDAFASDQVWTTCPTAQEYEASITVDPENGPFRQGITGQVACTSSSSTFELLMQNRDVDVIILTGDLSGVRTIWGVPSRSGQKVIDANGHRLTMSGSDHIYFRDGSLSNVVIKNAKNLFSTNNTDNTGMFRSREPLDLHLVDSAYNSEQSASAGHFGSSWESGLHIHGTSAIHGARNAYSVYYRQVTVHDGASFRLSGQNGGIYTRANTDRNGPDAMGLIVGEGATATIEARNGRALHATDTSFPMVFEAGRGAVVTMTGERAFHASAVPLTFRVEEGADVRLTGTNAALGSDGSSQWRGTFTIAPDANVLFERTSSERGHAVELGINATFTVRAPEQVEIKNRNGPLFNRIREQTFTVEDVVMKSWLSDSTKAEPDHLTKPVPSGGWRFTWDGTVPNSELLAIEPDFATRFPIGMNRFVMNGVVIDPPVLDEPVFDTAKSVTGAGMPLQSVRLTHEESQESWTVDVDEQGRFSVSLGEQALSKGDTLIAVTLIGSYESKEVRVTVEGNRLTLLKPEEIRFPPTVITDRHDAVILRDSAFRFRVLDTRSEGSWSVGLYAKTPMTNEAGDRLTEALYVRADGADSMIEGMANQVTVGRSSAAVPGEKTDTFDTVWQADEGLIMKVNPITASSESPYRATLVWTVTSGP